MGYFCICKLDRIILINFRIPMTSDLSDMDLNFVALSSCCLVVPAKLTNKLGYNVLSVFQD